MWLVILKNVLDESDDEELIESHVLESSPFICMHLVHPLCRSHSTIIFALLFHQHVEHGNIFLKYDSQGFRFGTVLSLVSMILPWVIAFKVRYVHSKYQLKETSKHCHVLLYLLNTLLNCIIINLLLRWQTLELFFSCTIIDGKKGKIPTLLVNKLKLHIKNQVYHLRILSCSTDLFWSNRNRNYFKLMCKQVGV